MRQKKFGQAVGMLAITQLFQNAQRMFRALRKSASEYCHTSKRSQPFIIGFLRFTEYRV